MITLCQTQQEVEAIAGPKHVWVDGARIVVYTGEDIPQPEVRRVIPADEFRGRFTDAELAAILALAYTGDSNAQMLLLKTQTNSTGIPLDDPAVVGGLAYLVSKGVLMDEAVVRIRG